MWNWSEQERKDGSTEGDATKVVYPVSSPCFAACRPRYSTADTFLSAMTRLPLPSLPSSPLAPSPTTSFSSPRPVLSLSQRATTFRSSLLSAHHPAHPSLNPCTLSLSSPPLPSSLPPSSLSFLRTRRELTSFLSFASSPWLLPPQQRQEPCQRSAPRSSRRRNDHLRPLLLRKLRRKVPMPLLRRLRRARVRSRSSCSILRLRLRMRWRLSPSC